MGTTGGPKELTRGRAGALCVELYGDTVDIAAQICAIHGGQEVDVWNLLVDDVIDNLELLDDDAPGERSDQVCFLRDALLSNHHVDQTALLRLFRAAGTAPGFGHRAWLVTGSPNTSAAVLLAAARATPGNLDSLTETYFVQHPNAGSELYTYLAFSGKIIGSQLAYADALTPDLLDHLAHSPYVSVQIRVAEHRNTSASTLRYLSEEGEGSVSDTAKHQLNVRRAAGGAPEQYLVT